ncbi:MAG: response regulator [Hyphomicrobiales bacterium]|nr:response regulator [Hyphomicrobiales bacterium]
MAVNAYATTPRGWVVGVAQLESTIVASHRSVLASTGLIMIGLALSSLLVAALLARHVAGRMQALADAAESLGDGKPVTQLAPPFREASAITDALQKASSAIAYSQAALEDKVIERTKELHDEMERRQKSEAQSRQLLRMQAIGQLTGGIAHDFNNMLAVVISSLSLLKRRLAAGRRDIEDLIEGGLDGAQRAASLTQRLLAFARQQPLSPQRLDVNRMIQSLGELIRRTIGEDIRIETVLAGGLWSVYADASQLENAVLNLVVNARDAMPEGGKLTIETSNSFLDDEYVRDQSEVASGQYVMIAVTDTGTGMSPEAVARAFEPFFTTKGLGRGTGLGLAQVYGFVKQSRGHARIYSEEGHGTTVKLYLPRHAGSDEVIVTSPTPAVVERGSPSECILVVEDEARVRQLSSETLRDLGYRVLEADGAVSALAHIGADPGIALLFTDIVMPDVNGRKLADQALTLNPNLKVLYTTGFTRNAVIHNGMLDIGVSFIAKPFTIEALARKVREVLDG